MKLLVLACAGVFNEPLSDLLKVLASLVDSENRILVPGFHDRVRLCFLHPWSMLGDSSRMAAGSLPDPHAMLSEHSEPWHQPCMLSCKHGTQSSPLVCACRARTWGWRHAMSQGAGAHAVRLQRAGAAQHAGAGAGAPGRQRGVLAGGLPPAARHPAAGARLTRMGTPPAS